MTTKAMLHQDVEALLDSQLEAAALALAALKQAAGAGTITGVGTFAGTGRAASLYDTDFYAWTQAQAQALRAKDGAALDLDHLAEEIEALGNEQRHAVQSHLRVLLWHLLKWTYQPDHRTTSWRLSIVNARTEIDARLSTSPSLRPHLPALLQWAYPRARKAAAIETDLPLPTFPESCPWPLERVLDEDWWPPEA